MEKPSGQQQHQQESIKIKTRQINRGKKQQQNNWNARDKNNFVCWLLVFLLLMKVVVAIKTCSCHWIIGENQRQKKTVATERRAERSNAESLDADRRKVSMRKSSFFQWEHNGSIELYVNILKLNRYDVICCNPMLMTASSTQKYATKRTNRWQ